MFPSLFFVPLSIDLFTVSVKIYYMRIRPVLVLSFVLLFSLGTFVYFQYGFCKNGSPSCLINLDKKVEDSDSFENIVENESYVEVEGFGRLLGTLESNEGVRDYTEAKETSAPWEPLLEFDEYWVENVVDAGSGEVLLRDALGGSKQLVFQCDVSRTFMINHNGLGVLVSSFDFMQTIKMGDRVYTKCSNDACSVLGPDCIISRKATDK